MTTFVPGDRIESATTNFVSGAGTYVHANYIISSVYGQRQDIQSEDGKTVTITVVNHNSHRIILPEVKDVVLCKVIRIMDAYAKVQIFCVQGQALRRSVEGMIRKQDVRENEIDSVNIGKSFLPGDIVKCTVISLGDRRSYFLSTASSELGVLSAISEAGNAMEAVAHNEMIDPKTKQREFRKVAKLPDFEVTMEKTEK
jgi:exosome complex component CSL4